MKKRKKIDWWILGPYLTLSMIGLLEVYSASSYRLLQADENTKSLLLRQLIFIFLSWSVIFLARSKDENGRSDSLLVAQYNQKTQQAKLISIMRDSYVDIPGYGMNKINAAYSYGGVDLLNQTLKENFKFEAPYYASITFQDFIDCVNELFPGGVKIDAEKSLDLDGVYINKGEQVMDGNTLLQYARFREDKEGDFERIRRQQQVIKAISQQLKDVTSIFKLPKAVGKLLGSI